jgi:hypothetical protein
MKTTFTFFNDPGHGWVAVPTSILWALGISHEISHYSYLDRRSGTAYLEEDSDALIFVNAYGEENLAFNEKYTDDDSFVRDLPSYSFPA